MKRTPIPSLFCLLICLASFTPAFAQTTTFTYQGFLTDGGAPATGVYDFQFNLFAGSSGGSALTAPYLVNDLGVTNGLYTASVDFGSTPFDGSDRWLEIGVRPGVSTGAYTNVVPRQRITSVPYAIRAANLSAAGLIGTYGNAVTFNNAGNSFSGDGTGLTSLNASSLSSGTVADGRLSANVALLNRNPQTFTGQNLFNGNELDIFTGNRKVSINPPLSGSGGLIGFSRPDDGQTQFLIGGSAAPKDDLVLYGSGGGSEVRLVSGAGGPTGFGFYLGIDSTTAFGSPRPTNSLAVKIDGSGRVGIGTASPAYALDVVAGQGGGSFTSTNAYYGTAIQLINRTPSQGSLGAINFVDAGANTLPGQILYNHTFDDSMHFRVESDDAVQIRKGGITITTSGAYAAYGGSIRFISDLDFSSPNNLGSILFDNSAGTLPGSIRYDANNNSMVFRVNRNDYLTIASDGTVSVPVLQINGADVAEPFKVSSKDMPKGSIMIIDEENPGQLKLSERAYDRRVAGILSGANGVNSGLLLKQQGFNDGGQNVALSGRVYALADASFGAIKSGDLLTTSDTPGHCMKVTDHARAQGAIVGKAMSSLKEGKGMVLVLVSLQ